MNNNKCYICNITLHDPTLGDVPTCAIHEGVDDKEPLIICSRCHDILGLCRTPANTDALCTNVPELMFWCKPNKDINCKQCLIENKELIRKNILLSRVT